METEAVIRIAITSEAYEVIAATLPYGSVGYETKARREGRSPDLA